MPMAFVIRWLPSGLERDRPPMTTAANPISTTGGFTEDAFEAFLKGRDEPAWLGRAPPRGVRRVPGVALAEPPRRGMAADRHPRPEARRLRAAAPREPPAPRTSPPSTTSGRPSARTMPRGSLQVNGVAARAPDAAKLGGAVFVDLAPRGPRSRRAARALPADRRRSRRGRRLLRGAARGVLDRRGTLLYVPKGVKLEAPLFSLVGLARGGRVDMDHTLIVLEEGAEATLVRETAGAAATTPRPGSARRGRRDLRRPRGAGSGSSTSRTGTSPPGTSAANGRSSGRDAGFQWTVGGLGSRLAKVNQEVVLAGPGAECPGQRRHVHHRAAAPRLLHPAGPPGPPHHQRPALQGRASRTVRGSSGRG